jgi:hypothetical protein
MSNFDARYAQRLHGVGKEARYYVPPCIPSAVNYGNELYPSVYTSKTPVSA